MQRIMQNNCAVFRNADVLAEGKKLIHEVWEGIGDIRVTDRSLIWNTDLVETLEFSNLIMQAAIAVTAPLSVRKAVAPMRAQTFRTATTRSG